MFMKLPCTNVDKNQNKVADRSSTVTGSLLLWWFLLTGSLVPGSERHCAKAESRAVNILLLGERTIQLGSGKWLE